jgi:thiol-disulfide isomerase/thioredoxin
VLFYIWRYRRAPELELAEITTEDNIGQVHQLDQILSDSAVVLCYASWCGPCLKELRSLKTNWHLYANSGIRFYCITDDSPDKIEVMRNSMPESITFLHIRSLKDIGIYTIPATYFCLNRKVVDKQLEAIDWPNENIQIKFN